jgi:hypothetical protein
MPYRDFQAELVSSWLMENDNPVCDLDIKKKKSLSTVTHQPKAFSGLPDKATGNSVAISDEIRHDSPGIHGRA